MKTGKENQYMTHRGSQIWVSNFSLENTGAKRHAKYVRKYK